MAKRTDEKVNNKKTAQKTKPKAASKTAVSNNENIKTISTNSVSLEVICIFIICVSILMVISVYFEGGGFLGGFLSTFLKGSFGIGAYLLPVVLLVTCISLFFSETKKINVLKLSLIIITFILISTLFHIIEKDTTAVYPNYGLYIASQYKDAGALDGGVFGALFGDLLLKIMGKFASITVTIIVIITSIFMLMGKSFLKSIVAGFRNISDYFYYENTMQDNYEEDIDIKKRKKIRTSDKIKNRFENRKDVYLEEETLKSQMKNKKEPNTNIEKEEIKFKKYNNYIYDGTDKYKKVEKPVIFNMVAEQKAKENNKISLALDEISANRPIKQSFDLDGKKNTSGVPEFLKTDKWYSRKNVQENKENENQIENQNQVYAENEHIASQNDNINIQFYNEPMKQVPYTETKATDEDEVNYEFENRNKDLFKIQTKDEYINNVYMKKKPTNDSFNIEERSINLELKLNEKTNLDEFFKSLPEDFIPLEDKGELEKLNDFYDFDTDELKHENYIEDLLEDEEKEILLEESMFMEERVEETDKESNEDIFNIKTSAYTPKDKDGYTKVRQNDYNTSHKKEDKESLMNEKEIRNIQEPLIIKAEKEKVVVENSIQEEKEYLFPKLSFLSQNPNMEDDDNNIELRENSNILIKTLKSFNINAQVINISKGPSVTRYELSIEDGIKVSKILGLADNLALSLAASSIRIEAPIPGKSAVGIEIPNKEVKSVFFSEIVGVEKFQKFPSKMSFGLGKDITGNVIVTDIAKMPHMLIAGATGSGKSVCINTLISSILYKATPDEVKLMMIDPKVVELSVYNGIPHLLTPVVTEPEKAAGVLNWAVSEMMDRYSLFAETGTRNLLGYNEIMEKEGEKKLPQIVIIIDELADLMMVAAKEVEASICRLAQLARAAGIHLIIATQRPSVDVITGLIKANIPSRIAFAVSSGTDSRTVLDTVGAEKLLGKGDMLFRAVDMNKPLRIQGAFITDSEVEKIVSFIKENNTANYDESIISKIENSAKSSASDSDSDFGSDEIIDEVISFLVRKGKASTSMIQRQFRIGYNRAARIIEELEDRGIVSSENGSKQREVLMDKYQYEEYQNRYDNY